MDVNQKGLLEHSSAWKKNYLDLSSHSPIFLALQVPALPTYGHYALSSCYVCVHTSPLCTELSTGALCRLTSLCTQVRVLYSEQQCCNNGGRYCSCVLDGRGKKNDLLGECACPQINLLAIVEQQCIIFSVKIFFLLLHYVSIFCIPFSLSACYKLITQHLLLCRTPQNTYSSVTSSP